MTTATIQWQRDGVLRYYPTFIEAPDAADWFERLHREVPWRSERYRIYGREVEAPRRVAWHGDAQAVYVYSGVVHRPLAWTPALLKLRDAVAAFTGQPFNSVLCNLYRDGRDSVGWHADKEPELGDEPFIASLSFGAERVFKLRHNKQREVHDLVLEDGSLLVMGGPFQRCWRHCLPKSRRVHSPRINLTFRYVIASK